MMKTKTRSLPYWLMPVAAMLAAALFCPAQTEAPAKSAPSAPAQKPETQTPDRTQSYFHLGLAAIYEEEAMSSGQSQYIGFAVEEYKKALNTDPTSPQLNDALADLYFRSGRVHEAEMTARELLKTSPDDADANKLLGRICLRELGEVQNGVSSSSPSGNALDRAISQFEKIVSLQPKSVEDRMVLGQLYSVKHQTAKAEEQFKIAKSIEPDSEEVVLNLARMYAESGDLAKAAKVIEDVPVADRSPKMEAALGSTYEQMKKPKEAIAAYQRAVSLEPGDVRTMDALAQALLTDNQLDEALKAYRQIAEADGDDVNALVRICEIERRQGKYEEALATVRKAAKKDPNSLEAGYNEGLLLDVLGRYDDAVTVYERMVELTSHANGAYTGEEKNNRGIFLERLASVYHEQNRTADAIAAYQKLVDMGGESVVRGYQGQVETYRDAKMFEKAVETSRKAVAADPTNRDLKLMLAGELIDLGKTDEGLAMAKGLLENNDKDRAIWMTLAQMNIRARRWKDAEDALNRASVQTSTKDDKIYLYFVKGELAERQHRIDAAEQAFKQVLDLDANNAMTLNYMGYMLADKGLRLPEALKMVRKAVEQEPMNGAYLDSLGWVYFKMGEYELSEENLRRAVERTGTDPTVHDHLGDLYEKTGRIRLAAAQWELSLAEFAKSAPADVEQSDVSKVQKKLESARVKLARQDSATGQAKPE